MKAIFGNWNLLRVFRLVLAIMVLVQAFVLKDVLIGLLAAFLAYTALANKGCCNGNNCAVNHTKQKKEYEEMDLEK